MSDTVLVTGGAGYIGSHLAAALLERGARVVVLDDLSRGTEDAVRRAQAVGAGDLELEVGDLGDGDFVAAVLARWQPDAVAHLAAFKSVAESVRDPELYERNNVHATAVLGEALAAARIDRVVYASTASVYGDPENWEQVTEDDAIRCQSPYAETKYLGEQVLEAALAPASSVIHLRFFNVCGAHPSGELGEYVDVPQNLVPVLLRAAVRGEPVTVFGTDWPTRDGTCVRDYVHVMDIAAGMVAALDATRIRTGPRVYNLGTGTGSTVLEVIDAVTRAVGRPFEVVHGPRRAGDPAAYVADAGRIARELGWRAQYTLEHAAAHAWTWTARHGR